MSWDEFICDECGERNVIKYLPPTLDDPGCYAEDLECSHCGAPLNGEDAEPFDAEQERWDNHPDMR